MKFKDSKSRPAAERPLKGERLNRGQTTRNTCLRFFIEQPMNRTAPWSKWDSFFASLRKRLSD